MPRPVKCRKVCHFPNILEFLPADNTEKKTPIVLTVDEYETIRLLDKEGYSQEQCAVSMQIARTTVQRIYEIARKKIGVTGFEPATSWSQTRRSSQAEPHPGDFAKHLKTKVH